MANRIMCGSTCQANLERFRAAVADLDVFLEHVPDVPEGWYNLGESHNRLGAGTSKPWPTILKPSNLRPTFTTAYYNRAVIYESHQDYEHAIADLTEAHPIESRVCCRLQQPWRRLQGVRPISASLD